MPPRTINPLQEADRRIADVWDPRVAADVNDSQVKVARFGATLDWHAHPGEDEAFPVLRGRIAIDVRDGTVELDEGNLLCVPRGTEHRPRPLTDRPITAMVGPASTLITGDARSDLAVADPKRL